MGVKITKQSHVDHEMTDAQLPDGGVLDRIQLLLDGQEWDAGTIEMVAELVRRSGREINEPNED